MRSTIKKQNGFTTTMTDPIKSPDGNFIWDGGKWLPASNNQSLEMQDSVISGDVVTNVSHNSADSEVLRVALEGVGKLLHSSPHHQQPVPVPAPIPVPVPVPTNNSTAPDAYLDSIKLQACDDEYKYDIIHSPMLGNKLRNAVDRMNLLGAKGKQFPSSIDLHSYHPETSNYLIEIWDALCEARIAGSRKETSDMILGFAVIGIVLGLVIYFVIWSFS